MSIYSDKLKNAVQTHIDYITKNNLKINPTIFKKSYPDEYSEIQKMMKENQIYFGESLYWIINNISKRPTCLINGPTCTHSVKFIGFFNGYSKYCNKCVHKAEEVKEKIRNSLLKKYGVDNIQKVESVKEKTRKTTIERYGEVFPGRHVKKSKQEDDTEYVEPIINGRPFRTGSTYEFNMRMKQMKKFLSRADIELLDYCGDECEVYIKCMKCNQSFEISSYLKLKEMVDRKEHVCPFCK